MRRSCTCVAIGAACLWAGCASDRATSRPDGDVRWQQDVRILSILHVRNQEAIRLGNVAQEKGSSISVRDFGAELARDRADNDQRVLATARSANITLMDRDEVEQLLRECDGEAVHEEDLRARLATLEGDAFDREFAA